MKEEFKSFSNRFNQNESNKPDSELDINSLETDYQIKLPADYREFLSEYGDLWTPNILDLIDDNELDLNDVQDFWKVERIKHDKENEWASQLDTDLIPFASDCMGNIFSFKTEQLKNSNETSEIYFFDHDFGTIELVSSSFTQWINEYLKIKE